MAFARFLAPLAIAATFATSAIAADITGAGATFPYPIYAKWADSYKKETGNGLNYQSIGSGGGIKQITAKTVDFGASDMPLKDEDLAKDGLVQFPTVIGGVVPVANLPGIKPGQLQLDGPTLADICLGKIKYWDDAAIKKLNPSANLPHLAVLGVHRSDGSGTNFIFTNYLSKVNAEWKARVGEGTAVNWPTGAGGKGNEGVAAYVQRLPNSIGYVEYAYAKQNRMAHVQLKNAAGRFVAPDEKSFKAAAAGADWSRSFHQLLTEQPGADAWPISGATYILMHKAPDKPERAAAALKFFDWAYAQGDAMAGELDYVPLPATLKAMVRKLWSEQIRGAGKAFAAK